ncbi:Wall-associated receptor kinase, galacturonan-binding domain [Sesbania bispinosa]|nr:Wall-associated receptor kinase, galacturonan-binding domain [Sesbania bispinosa]
MTLFTKQHLILVMFLITAKAASKARPDECPTSCGSLKIPYPFGMSEGCYLDHSFFINCTHNHNPIPHLPHPNTNMIVLNISLNDGELLVSSPVARYCFRKRDTIQSSLQERKQMFNLTHFSVSPTRNKFTAVGCNTIGVYKGDASLSLTKNVTEGTGSGACLSLCNKIDEVSNGSCSDTGCCQIPIYKQLSYNVVIATTSVEFDSGVHEYPCSYAFIGEEGAYSFSSTDLIRNNLEKKKVPMVLDWAVGNETCQEAKQNETRYACKADKSECLNSTNRMGYRCKCLSGFEGNPYLYDGCQDIKECNMEPSPCSGICHELEGNYTCSCPEGYEVDGYRSGIGCYPKGKSRTKLAHIIAVGGSLGILALLVGSLYLYSKLRKAKLNKIRQKYFQQNGGILLKQRIAAHQGSTERATIFTAQEMKKATNNYDEDRVIGKGGHGTVYKGVLSDNRVVAIKKTKISSQTEIEQFINEVLVLSQTNHRNIVKLLGCCLEIEVPLLVYEFITNGTLSEHIHVEGQASQLSWQVRLRVAAETAEALAYLHSAASTPIIHRDVKTENILLDDNLTAKVSDFGASKLIPINKTQLTTLVQGTLGYLDPEYFQSSQLTEKSDVYSFGVVLAELLTSMKALSFMRPESDRNLSNYFVSLLSEGRLPQILDNNIVNDANFEQIMEVAYLVKRCLMLKGEERPTMKEVAMELERIRTVEKLSSTATNLSLEETEYSFRVPRSPYTTDGRRGSGGSSIITGVDSIQTQVLEPLDEGR